MSDEKKGGDSSRGAFIITMAAVTGLCLIAKVWIVRHGFDQPIEVNDVIIPTAIPVLADAIDHLYRKKAERRWRWNHPVLWSVIIVIATGLSLLKYKS